MKAGIDSTYTIYNDGLHVTFYNVVVMEISVPQLDKNYLPLYSRVYTAAPLSERNSRTQNQNDFRKIADIKQMLCI
jgi:hypothetical protein